MWSKAISPFLKDEFFVADTNYGLCLKIGRKTSRGFGSRKWIFLYAGNNRFGGNFGEWEIKSRADLEEIPESLLVAALNELREQGYLKTPLGMLLSAENL